MQSRPAPDIDIMPYCTWCHGWALPSTDEYWHIGDTTMRLGSVTPPISTGVKSWAVMVVLFGGSTADRRSGLMAEPFLDQAAGDGIAARHEERTVLGQVLRPQLIAAEPQCAFELGFVDAEVEPFGLGVEADHHRGGKRPGLRRTVGHVLHLDLDLLVDPT